MAKHRIEHSADRTRGGITPEEIRAGIAETKRRRAQPGYVEAEKRRLEDAARRAKAKGVKFPELAKRGTQPVLVTTIEARKRLNSKIAKF